MLPAQFILAVISRRSITVNKKILLISIIAVVVVAAGSFGVLLLTRKAATPATVAAKPFDTKGPAAPDVVNAPDTSKDFGACNLVVKTTISQSIGKAAANLQGPDNLGLGHLSAGDEAQSCVYSFITGGTFDNSFNAQNGFTIEAYVHANQQSLDNAKSAKPYGVQPSPVPNIADSAAYASFADKTNQKQISVLQAYKGLKRYSFTLSQPAAGALSANDAQTALTTIAKSANY